jgi:hypothetical protein
MKVKVIFGNYTTIKVGMKDAERIIFNTKGSKMILLLEEREIEISKFNDMFIVRTEKEMLGKKFILQEEGKSIEEVLIKAYEKF